MDILDTSYKTLSDYLIDNQINIYNDDDYKIKFKKILLKYKRIIGIILLILFLIIGYYEYNIDTYEYINIKFQTGGEIGKIKGFSGATHFISKRYQDLKGIKKEAKVIAAAGTQLRAETKAIKKEIKQEKKTERRTALKQKATALLAKVPRTAKGLGKAAIKGTYKSTYAVGAYGAETVRENADYFYGMLYAIVLSLAICIITIPSIAFFIMGLICYVLLKDKMKIIKGL